MTMDDTASKPSVLSRDSVTSTLRLTTDLSGKLKTVAVCHNDRSRVLMTKNTRSPSRS